MGDFNLDDSKRNATDYRLKDYYEELNNTFDPHNLMQVINFQTWQIIVNNVVKESILDHVYEKKTDNQKHVQRKTTNWRSFVNCN